MNCAPPMHPPGQTLSTTRPPSTITAAPFSTTASGSPGPGLPCACTNCPGLYCCILQSGGLSRLESPSSVQTRASSRTSARLGPWPGVAREKNESPLARRRRVREGVGIGAGGADAAAVLPSIHAVGSSAEQGKYFQSVLAMTAIEEQSALLSPFWAQRVWTGNLCSSRNRNWQVC